MRKYENVTCKIERMIILILCGVYSITNSVNNKRYIGQTTNIDKRIKKHIWELNNGSHAAKELLSDWIKYGKESFLFNILEICEKKDLKKNEAKWMEYYNTTKAEYGYNSMGSKTYGVASSKELRRHRSETIIKNYKDNPERKRKTSEGIINFYINHPEARKAQSEISKKRFNDSEYYEKFLETMRSDEHRKKMSAINKGRKHSKEAARNIAQGHWRKVLCVETGVVFESVLAAKEAYNITSHIGEAASGKRKTAGGYHWKYV